MSIAQPPPTKGRPITDAEATRLRQVGENQDAIALLDSWADASEAEIQEQRETWEFLRQALDEDRPSYRQLFS